MGGINYQTIKVRFSGSVCYLSLSREDSGNKISARLVEECRDVIQECDAATTTVLVLEGSSKVFCLGADFDSILAESENKKKICAAPLYNLWKSLAVGPFISVAHVRGKVSAGGIGFVSACDVVLADNTANFCLSEMLFNIYPALVMPFLIRKIGNQRAHYLTLLTKPVLVSQAKTWGLVDACADNSENLLHRHLQRFSCFSKQGITRYKNYANKMHNGIDNYEDAAVNANQELFSDSKILEGIGNYVETGQFPWQY